MNEDNPYRPPEVDSNIAPERISYRELDTKTLKRLRNHSHTIRTLGALSSLGSLLGLAMIFLRQEGSSSVFVMGLGSGVMIFCAYVSYSSWWRPSWGRMPGVLYCILALLGFPIGTAIGIFGLIAFGGGAALYGPDRYLHTILESEWKYRKKHKIP